MTQDTLRQEQAPTLLSLVASSRELPGAASSPSALKMWPSRRPRSFSSASSALACCAGGNALATHRSTCAC